MRNFLHGYASFGFASKRRRVGDPLLAPVISGFSTTGAPDSMSMTVSVDATVYWLLGANATRTPAQIIAGGGQDAGSQSVTAGTINIALDFSAVADGSWYLHIVADNGTSSNVINHQIALSSGPVTDANVTAILANGWEASYTSPPTFDPVGSPKYVVVDRPGFNASGAGITVTDNLLIMSRVRQPYPTSTKAVPVWTTSDVALQDFIYSGDVVTGVTNNSTRAYPKPLAMWLDHDLQRVTGQSYTAKLAVAHWHARSGRPVAAVKFIATDGTTTVEQTVSAMTKTTYAASGLSVPHFEATLDFSTLSNDALITIDAVIYPWVGTSAQASVNYAAYPSISFCERKVFNAVTAAEATIFAYVDGVGGGTPQVSATEATALANPYATVTAAAAAVQTLDGTDASRGLIKITASTTITHASFSSVVVGPTPLIIQGVAKATSVYQDAGSNTSNSLPDKMKFKDLTFRRNAATNVIFLDNGALAGSANMLVTENCTFDQNTHGVSWNAFVYKPGRCYFIDTDGLDISWLSVFGTSNKMVNLIGSVVVDAVGNQAKSIFNSIGSKLGQTVIVATNVNQEAVTTTFYGFNFIGNTSTSTSALTMQFNTAMVSAGLAFVGNIVEQQKVVNGAACLHILADGNTIACDNHIIHQNTVLGQRFNFHYNDTAPYAVKIGSVKFCAIESVNTKSDIHALNATAINNWSDIHKVGWHSNAYLYGDSSQDAFGAGQWLGEFAAIGDVAGTNAVPVVADWTNDQSADGGQGGTGNYSPGVLTALPNIPAGLAPYPYDLNGVAVANDGTAYAGAAQ